MIVIPCLAEEGIMQTLDSLQRNVDFHSSAECIIVVNHAESATDNIKSINRNLIEQINEYSTQSSNDQIKFFTIEAFDLPDKKAGVGRARKAGLDFARSRLNETASLKDGILVCLDGDCTVADNYFREIEIFFAKQNANGCSLFFEHPLDGENSLAIIDYELFLRYYIDALRWSDFPKAFQTVGSSMAVTAVAYEKQGGMNTRMAGEDFYFLNKIIQLGNFGDLVTTTVYPSSRKSERVPFGTGREMIEWEQTGKLLAYHPDLFVELKKILEQVVSFHDSKNPIELLEKNKVHPAFVQYFYRQNFNAAISEAVANTATLEAFRKRFFVWMDAFRIMKALNELSISSFSKIPIYEAASWLWPKLSDEPTVADNQSLLMKFREFDRGNPKFLT